MSRLGSVQVKGTREFKARLAALIAKYPRAIKSALFLEANLIMTDSKEHYVPVNREIGKGGTLRDSGIVQKPVQEGLKIYVRMGFGGEAMPYAEAVHEHLSRHSPPTWQGKPILNWSIPGTGPKYLEIPFRKAEKGMANRLAAHLKAETEGR